MNSPVLRAALLWLALLGLLAAAIVTRDWWWCVAFVAAGLIAVLAVCGNSVRDVSR